MKQFVLPLCVFAAISTAIVLFVRSPAPLPDLGPLAASSFTDQTGAEVTSAQLTNLPSLWSFFFTSCQGPCPATQAEMARIQRHVAGKAEIRLVSVSIDPANDTPETMTAYAAKIGASLENWSFLRADEAAVAQFAKESFHTAVDTGALIHTTRIALVDRSGRVRGLYDSTDFEQLARLEKDALRLAADR